MGSGAGSVITLRADAEGPARGPSGTLGDSTSNWGRSPPPAAGPRPRPTLRRVSGLGDRPVPAHRGTPGVRAQDGVGRAGTAERGLINGGWAGVRIGRRSWAPALSRSRVRPGLGRRVVGTLEPLP